MTSSNPPHFSADTASKFIASNYAIDITVIDSLGSYIDQNFHIVGSDSQQYVFKIHDITESLEVLDFQNQAMQFLIENLSGIQFPRLIETDTGEVITTIATADGGVCNVRLLTYVSGTLLEEVSSFSPELLGNIGVTLAKMDSIFANFSHPAANRPDIPWDMKNASQVGQLYSKYITNVHTRRIVEYFFLQFETEVAPQLIYLTKSIVHNDSHCYSLLVNDDLTTISGVIDFGDIVYTYKIFNLAVALSDILRKSLLAGDNLIEVASVIIQHYHQNSPLQRLEIEILYYLICTRLAIYLSMSAFMRDEHPDNQHSQLKANQVESLLRKLLAINPKYATQQFKRACQLDDDTSHNSDSLSSALEKRQKHFSKSIYTHYDQPIDLHKGALQYLYGSDGNTYLDCVNNVSQWGHCHPHIVQAAQQQSAKLNTNSRYLYEQMGDYAESLLSTFPESYDTCFLVNSGSEANDLAMRMTQAYTNRKDFLVIDRSYHGNSSACNDISPNRIDRTNGPGLPHYVHSTLIPDIFRGKYRSADHSDPSACEKYIDDIKQCIETLNTQQTPVAGFIAESLIGTAGQIVLPENYLHYAYQLVRDAGGICIADEVQVGFGRTGDNIWCFQSQHVEPDIVTLGKPIANGHPMGAVITRREIANAFDDSITYFNTFGGNPVSCAIGLAVLNVLENEGIQNNVIAMSRLLMRELQILKSKYPIIADIRGKGLYIGVELIQADTLQPATNEAKFIVEKSKQLGVLINVNGYDYNILKIKPPLIIGATDVEKIVQVLDVAFANLAKMTSN